MSTGAPSCRDITRIKGTGRGEGEERKGEAKIKFVKNYLGSSSDGKEKGEHKTARNNPMKRSLINRFLRPSGN